MSTIGRTVPAHRARRQPLRVLLAVTLVAILGAPSAAVLPSRVAAASGGTGGRVHGSTLHRPSPAAAAPVIVRGVPGDLDRLIAAVHEHGGRVTRALPIIDAVAAQVPTRALAALRLAPGVAAVALDTSVRPHGRGDAGKGRRDRHTSLESLTRAIGARSLWQQGYTGRGVDIALIDTGVAPVEGMRPPGKVVNGADLSFDSQEPDLRYLDAYGHGTHLAGIAAGRDTQASATPGASDGAFLGVAPDARIVNVKVGATDGAADVSQVIAALDWVVTHRRDRDLDIRVVLLAFGTDSEQPWAIDPLAYAAEVAWRKGIVVVAAAGNETFGSHGLSSPASDPWLLAVAASDLRGTATPDDDTTPAFSSTGDGSRAPDISAPGTSVDSLRVPGSWLDVRYKHAREGDRLFTGSGTSQAAAAVAGGVALLLQARPSLGPDEVKWLLRTAAAPTPRGKTGAMGQGRIDLVRALGMSVGDAAQALPFGSGGGSLEAARGSVHVEDDDVALEGERDIHSRRWQGDVWAERTWQGRAWSDGTWNDETWTGDGWSAGTWAGDGWATTAWTSRSWSSRSWSTRSWSSRSWSGKAWKGGSWKSRSWSAEAWHNDVWATGRWGR